jgi:hypothetical protein
MVDENHRNDGNINVGSILTVVPCTQHRGVLGRKIFIVAADSSVWMYLADTVLSTLDPGTELPVRSEKIDVVGTNVVLSQSDDRSLKTDFAVVVEDGLRNVSQLRRHEFRR